jgi:hypothetical protein
MKTIEKNIMLEKSKLKSQVFPTRIRIHDDNTYEINEVYYFDRWNNRSTVFDDVGFSEKNVYSLCVWWWIVESFENQYGKAMGLTLRDNGEPLNGEYEEKTGIKIVMPIA